MTLNMIHLKVDSETVDAMPEGRPWFALFQSKQGCVDLWLGKHHWSFCRI